MSWPRDFLNQGVHIGGRQVAGGSIPESAPSAASDGFDVVHALSSGIAISPPSILILPDIEGGVSPTATLQVYGYYPEASDLLSMWQLLQETVVEDPSTPIIIQSALGAKRLAVVVLAVTGAPTSVRLVFRAVSGPFQLEAGGDSGSSALEFVNVSAIAVAEGNNSLTGFTDKALIKRIKITSNSVNWTLTLYSKDDYASDPLVVMKNRVGNWGVSLDLPYEDKDASTELHCNFTDHNGANTYDIAVWGVKAV